MSSNRTSASYSTMATVTVTTVLMLHVLSMINFSILNTSKFMGDHVSDGDRERLK